jgi:NAD-dependent DNA ligase
MVVGASAQVELKQMEHFCATLDVKHVATGTLKKMYDAGINTIPKLLKVTEADLLKIDGFQSVSAKRVVDGLATVKNATCAELMIASNIFGRGFGKKRIDLILSRITSILEEKVPSVEELQEIDGIGKVSAQAFLKQLPYFFAFMKEIGAPRCLTVPHKSEMPCTQSFAHQSIVFTGFRNKGWSDIIERCGGTVTNTVTSKTTLVVAVDPDEKNTKLDKARALNTLIISKDAFEKRLLS